MSVIKCPRCEINFIKEEDGYCPICLKEMKGEASKDEAPLICIECGEHPVIENEELCLECLKAHQLVADIPIEEIDDDEDDIKKDDEDGELSDEDLSVDDELGVEIPEADLIDHDEWEDLEDEAEDEAEDEIDEFDGFYEEDVHDILEEESSKEK